MPRLQMRHHKIIWFGVWNLAICFNFSLALLSQQPLILIVAFDGFKSEFLTPFLTPNLFQIAQYGAFSSNGMQVQYVTSTTPNFVSISTGLHTESHGIIDNQFYDPVLQQYYDYWNFSGDSLRANGSLAARWYTGTPIWQINDDAAEGRASGCLYWPTCEAHYNGRELPKYVRKWTTYGNLSDWQSDLDVIFDWFQDRQNPVNLLLYYIAEPDETEHHQNLFGSEVRDVYFQIDQFAADLMQRIYSHSLLSRRLNVIFLSDHGHTAVQLPDKIIDLSSFLSHEEWDQLFYSSAWCLMKKDNSNLDMTAVYNKLKEKLSKSKFKNAISVWLKGKGDFPNDKYHWERNRRAGTIIIQPKLGYFMIKNYTNYSEYQGPKIVDPLKYLKDKNKSESGSHGYLSDEREMNGLFLAVGPAFKRHFHVDNFKFENIDLFPLLCYILKLDCPLSNGSFENVKSMLNVAPDFSDFGSILDWIDWKVVALLLFVVLLPAAILLLFCCDMLCGFNTSSYLTTWLSCSNIRRLCCCKGTTDGVSKIQFIDLESIDDGDLKLKRKRNRAWKEQPLPEEDSDGF